MWTMSQSGQVTVSRMPSERIISLIERLRRRAALHRSRKSRHLRVREDKVSLATARAEIAGLRNQLKLRGGAQRDDPSNGVFNTGGDNGPHGGTSASQQFVEVSPTDSRDNGIPQMQRVAGEALVDNIELYRAFLSQNRLP